MIQHATTQPRLDQLRLTPPPSDRFERRGTPVDLTTRIAVHDVAGRVTHEATLPLPLVWLNPPWYLSDIERFRRVARVAADAGLMVSALWLELVSSRPDSAQSFVPRLATHRPDRAGWTFQDFEDPAVIELRIGQPRDAHGRFAHHASQMAIWNRPDGDANPNEFTAAPAAYFPPDWPNLEAMSRKVMQIRQLSSAAILVSFDSSSLDALLPAVISSRADGALIRCTGDPVETLHRARMELDKLAAHERPVIWLAADSLDAESCVKCMALGSQGFAVDTWANRWLLDDESEMLSRAERAALSLGTTYHENAMPTWELRIRTAISEFSEQLRGRIESLGAPAPGKLKPEHVERV